MAMNFQIGQRVICLGNWSSTMRRFRIDIPIKFQIYTIRAFCPNASASAILLEEVKNSKIVIFARTNKKGEPSFAANRFRPLFDLSSLLETQKELESQ